jgi:hypothetical protein
VERCLPHEQLVAHDSKSPDIHLVTIPALFQQLRRAVKGSAANTQLGVGSFKNRAEAEIRYLGLEINGGKVYRSQEVSFLITRHGSKFGVVGEMEQDVCQFHVSVNDVKAPYVFEACNNLTQNQANLYLGERFAESEEDRQIEAIAEVLHHVDVRIGLDGLVQSDALFTFDHVVETDFLLYAVHIVLANCCNLNNLARVHHGVGITCIGC